MMQQVYALLEKHKDWFATKDKKVWQPEELAITYEIFNLHFGENRVDTGCGSCRRSVINHVRKMYKTLEKQT